MPAQGDVGLRQVGAPTSLTGSRSRSSYLTSHRLPFGIRSRPWQYGKGMGKRIRSMIDDYCIAATTTSTAYISYPPLLPPFSLSHLQ